MVVLAATDPANPYGATLKWPDDDTQPQNAAAVGACGRHASVGATVILVNGALAAYLARGDRQLATFLPEAEPERSRVGRAVARVLIDRARASMATRSASGMLIEEIDGTAAGASRRWRRFWPKPGSSPARWGCRRYFGVVRSTVAGRDVGDRQPAAGRRSHGRRGRRVESVCGAEFRAGGSGSPGDTTRH